MKDRQAKAIHLLDEHGAQLHRLLSRLTLCEHVVGDLMQELFIRLSESRTFAKAENPLGFAWRAAVNLAYDWRKKHKMRCCSLEGEAFEVAEGESVVEKAIRAEEVKRVLEAAMGLDEPGRSVVLMRYIEQQSYEQIAETLGKNERHMRSLCSKSIGKLRLALAQQDDRDVKGAIA